MDLDTSATVPTTPAVQRFGLSPAPAAVNPLSPADFKQHLSGMTGNGDTAAPTSAFGFGIGGAMSPEEVRSMLTTGVSSRLQRKWMWMVHA